MAAGRKGRWIAIGGATAAVAIGVLATVALGAPSGLVVSPTVTKLQPHLMWTGDGATGYSVERGNGSCANFGPAGDTTGTTFDDTPPGDGMWCYRVTGHYPDGDQTGTDTASVLYDTTGPAVQITSPAANAVLKGSVTITASAPDAGSGLASLTISVDNQTVTPAGQGTAHWTPTGDGSYVVHAAATDVLGNASSATINVTVDNTPPAAFTIFAPSPVIGSPTLSWSQDPAYTYTVTRDGVAIPGTIGSPWTDQNPPVGSHTYVITATDGVGNQRTATASVLVQPLSVSAPQGLTATSPTNSVPHLTWQKPLSFAQTGWRIYRNDSVVATINDAGTMSYDDSSLGAQGAYTYQVQALSDSAAGDKSPSVSVIYDTTPPVLGPASATANADGSISIDWPDATDSGSGVAQYIVRRGSSPPSDASSGTSICTLTPPANACVDSTAKTGTSYDYAVFATDDAGNLARRDTSAKASDTLPPDPVTGVRALASSPTAVRLTWDVPPLKGKNADLAGYRVLQLRSGQKAPLGPQDGTVLCKDVDPDLGTCDALKLTKGKKVTFAVYAFDGVPNYSSPALFSFVPRKTDNKPPHKPTKVKLVHKGLRYVLTWVSPRDADLSKFRVTLYKKKPTRPSLGKAVVNGRVLGTTFLLKAGQRVYVTLYALDVSGNYSKVTNYVVAPGGIVAKSKHKVVKKKAVTKRPAVISTKPPAKKKPPKKDKPIPVQIG